MTDSKFPFEEGDTVKISFEAVVTCATEETEELEKWADFKVDSDSGYLDIESLPENTKYEVVKKRPREIGWWEVTFKGTQVAWWDGHTWSVMPGASYHLNQSPSKIGLYLGKGTQGAD